MRPPGPALEDAPEEAVEEEADALETEAAPISLEEYRVARPAPEAPPAPSRRLRDRRGRAPAARSGPSPMEVAALNYRHIKGDLLRIAILSLVMFGIIVALSFVIK